ncbi:hypothetical protein Vadar_029478 [Vaccinium darrowii]|uniref:Uncharacterized protein n=1 Tax=Vaccinium darrowii TaxID=229202 RepID=A0ACB7X599_9ERIC|nr:hypothetical protein Vadar_029478 [Vaccinium darrowii]
MEVGEELRLILAYLPVVARSSSLFWPSQVVEALKALSSGPNHSRVDSGEAFFLAISNFRQSLSSSSDRLTSSAAHGYCFFFDHVFLLPPPILCHVATTTTTTTTFLLCLKKDQYNLKDPRMVKYYNKVWEMIKEIGSVEVEWVGRERNSHADALASLATACAVSPNRTILLGDTEKPSIECEVIKVLTISLGPSWMDEIYTYLKHEKLPTDKKEAHWISRGLIAGHQPLAIRSMGT